jgi:ABC-2 type transport system ATP-binding protein
MAGIQPPPVQARGLSKRHGSRRRGGVQALQDVDITVPEGSITALVGPNGAGKTTFMKICTAFERPTSGVVEVVGIDPWKHRGKALRQLAYVPQRPALYRGLTVQDHLALARTYRPGFDAAYAQGRLEHLDIPLHQQASTLSGGQAAQLGLAIALGTRAHVLLLDEPLANLDPLARREFIQVLIQAVREHGSTAMISSHIVTDVEEGCDRLAIIGRGSVLLDTAVAEARATHFIGPSGASQSHAIEVGTYAGRNSERITLWRINGRMPSQGMLAQGAEPATLEDVVLGYLVAGRSMVANTAAGVQE